MEIKICGITNLEDALNAYIFGADAIGFIFYPKSPRYITPEAVKHISDNLPFTIARVGVFVNHELQSVRDIFKFCGLDMIQLHGDESPEYCRQFPETVLIKAFSPKSDEELDDIKKYPVKAILIDSRTADLYGGTGKKSNWELASKMSSIRPLILSGGLNPDNILEAIETVAPHAVDVNSGVEISRREKDSHKMKKVIEMVHGCRDRSSIKIFSRTFEHHKMQNHKRGDYMQQILPDKNGHFGIFGGRYVAETLMPALIELEEAYRIAKKDKAFTDEFAYYLKEYAGRETPLYFAQRLTELLGGAKIYLKREDLNHTGSHKINNTLGQALLAKRMGKKRVIAETGAGQHGVATATVAALFGMECRIFMGEEDIRRQAPNVFRMKILGAEVVSVTSGTATLKDAMNEAMRHWVSRVRDTFYVIGTTAGPHPYPMMVREFQSVIGKETIKQIQKKEGRFPDFIIACIGGGSNAMGIFYPFKDIPEVKMIGVEAAGKGISTGQHAASISAGRVGVLHGNKTYLLQDNDGQVHDAYSIAAGLDYPGVGPEHGFFKDAGRAQYVSIDDEEAIQAFMLLSKCEGIIPAMESAHAIAYAMKLAPTLNKNKIIVINLSGRGDKDAETITQRMENHQ